LKLDHLTDCDYMHVEETVNNIYMLRSHLTANMNLIFYIEFRYFVYTLVIGWAECNPGA